MRFLAILFVLSLAACGSGTDEPTPPAKPKPKPSPKPTATAPAVTPTPTPTPTEAPEAHEGKTAWTDTLATAKSQRKMALLVFFNKGVKDCKRYEEETLADSSVQNALTRFLICRIDPEGTDADNKLWQKNGSDNPPMTYVFDPDGEKLSGIGTLKASMYADKLNAAHTAYFQKILPAKAALAKDGTQADQHQLLGEAYHLLNQPKLSAESYDRAVSLLASKDKPRALAVAGDQIRAYYKEGWEPYARAACAKVQELDPSDGEKLGSLVALVSGLADCKENKLASAITTLTAATEKYKEGENAPKIMLVLGIAHSTAGEKDAAKSCFAKVMTLWPDSEQAKLAEGQLNRLTK